MPIHLLTPLGLFRRVEDSWSPRKEIILDKEAQAARARQQAVSPVKLPTHEILSHAMVYAVNASSGIVMGPCFLYEWLGHADGYTVPASFVRDEYRERDTREMLKADAAAALNEVFANQIQPYRLEVSFQGAAFNQ